MTVPGEQLYKLVIRATGEVRDSDGNLIASEPLTAEAVLTETEALDLIEREQS